MQNNLKRQTPASSGDELDVLQALHKIEKETGKKLLTPDQLNKLIAGGRVDQQASNKIESNNQALDKMIGLVMVGLESQVVVEIQALLGMEFWSALSDIDKRKIAYDYFLVMYGLSPEIIRNRLHKYFRN